ncbi:MAG: hypothetical protein PHX08_24390 [Lachnospiraceae bacterium]|nr:hypothetical protein [Lachnospiraceae bacterium]
MQREIIRIENGTIGQLHHVYLHVMEGEVINIVFDKNKEKKDFLEILAGRKYFDYARVYWHEEKTSEKQMEELFKRELSIVSRQSKLIYTLSISENIYLVQYDAKDIVSKKKTYEKRTALLFEQFGFSLSSRKKVEELKLVERIIVEILKGYILKQKAIVITNVVGLLNTKEVGLIWDIVEKLKQYGMAFLILEPFEDLLLERLDTINIVKAGRTVAQLNAHECDYKKVYAILNNNKKLLEHEEATGAKHNFKTAQNTILEFQNIKSEFLQKMNLKFYEGEVKRIIYLDEKSFNIIVDTFHVANNILADSITYKGKTYKHYMARRWYRKNVGIILENPSETLIFNQMSVLDNLCLLLYQKIPNWWPKKKYRSSVVRMLEGILDESILSKDIRDLEPHILQKIVYCRWLLYAPKLLVCIRPFADGDIKVRNSTREMLTLLSERGIPIILLTSDMTEVVFNGGDDMFIYRGEIIEEYEAYNKIYYKSRHNELKE